MTTRGIINKRRNAQYWNDFFHLYITVEPVMLLSVFANSILTPTIQALIYRKVCESKFNESICDNLKNYTKAEDAVQTDASYWSLVDNLSNMIPGILSAQILGAWSDKYGRRLVMTITICGTLVTTIGFLINSFSMKIHVSYVIIGSFLGGCIGNFGGSIMATYSYIGDVVEKRNRTFRNSITHSMMMLARTAAGAASGVLLDKTNYVVVFSFVISVLLFTALYIGLWLRSVEEQFKAKARLAEYKMRPACSQELSQRTYIVTGTHLTVIGTSESSGKKEANPAQSSKPDGISSSADSTNNTCQKLFGLKTFTGSLRCFAKKRTDNRRFHLALSLGTLTVIFLCFGTSGVQFLFLRRRPLSWDQTTYGYFNTVGSFSRFVSLLFAVPVLKSIFGVRDTILSGIGVICYGAMNVILAFSSVSWMAFLSQAVAGFGSVTFACIRSLMSCMVEPDEQGQMFALLTSLQSLGIVVSQLIFNLIYPETLDWFPGFVFLMAGLIHSIPLLLTIILHVQLVRYPVKGLQQIEEKRVQIARDLVSGKTDSTESYVVTTRL